MKDGDSGSEDYITLNDLPARIRATNTYEELVSLLSDELVKANIDFPAYCPTLSVHRERIAEAAAGPRDGQVKRLQDLVALQADRIHELEAAAGPRDEGLRKALEQIANLDYRGNRSPEQEIARAALAKRGQE